MPDEADNQTDHLSYTTSPNNEQDPHNTLYLTTSHFQRKLSAINEVEDSGEQSSGEREEYRYLKDAADNRNLEETRGVDRAESLNGKQEIKEEQHGLRPEIDGREAENVGTRSNHEEVEKEMNTEGAAGSSFSLKSDNDDLVNDTMEQFTEHNMTEFADVALNGSKTYVPNTETQSHILNNVETIDLQQKQQPLSDDRDSATVDNSQNGEKKFDHYTNQYIPSPIKAFEESSTVQTQSGESHSHLTPGHVDSEFSAESKATGQQLPEEPEAGKIRENGYITPPNIPVTDNSNRESDLNFTSADTAAENMDKGSSEISSDDLDLLIEEADKDDDEVDDGNDDEDDGDGDDDDDDEVDDNEVDEVDNSASEDVESESVTTKEHDSEPQNIGISPETVEQVSVEVLSGDPLSQTKEADHVEVNGSAFEDLGSDPGAVEENNPETASYIRENKSSPRKESFSLEDEVSLSLSTEKSHTDSLIEEIIPTSDNIITTESTISLESQPHYMANDDTTKISQGVSDPSETAVISSSDESSSQEKSLNDEEPATNNKNNEGFFTVLTDSITSTLKNVPYLGFGSSPSSSEEEIHETTQNQEIEDKGLHVEQEIKSGDSIQAQSLWNSVKTMEETAHHVATDPDQTGHKVDIEVPSGNILHSISDRSSVCESGISCSGQSGLIPSEPQQQKSSMSEDQEQNIESDFAGRLYGALSENVLYMVLTAIVTSCVLVFTVIVSHFLQKPRFIALTSNIIKLEKQLLCLKTENSTLREELKKKEEELSYIQISSVDTDKTVMQLKMELESSQAARTELEEQVASLEKELEAATEAGLELNRMLSDFLSTQHGSETLVKSVEHLQKQLDAQQLTIAEMNNNLIAKNQENENLQQELLAATEKLAVQEEELKKTTDSLVNIQKEKINLLSEMEEKIKALQLQLSQMSESTHSQITRLTSELEEARETVAMRDSELTVLQDCLRQLKALEEGQGSERLDALLDVGHARAELALVTMDRDSLKDRLHDEEIARNLLEDHVKVIKEEVNTLRSKFEEAEKEKVEAQTKLEVLSNYFKEKETQLQRELGLQEAMYIQKEGDATNTYERIKALQEEIEHYKSQNEMLKKEIIDQERSLKGQLATLEKKAHENWVAARQAERKLEESRQEAGQLRNRLTVIEKNIANTSNSLDSSKASDRLQAADSNGEIPTSFLHMGMQEMQDPSYHQHRDRDGHPVSPPLIPGQPLPPFMAIPPPGVFMPPPPLPGAPFVPPPPPPLFPGDRRPPPLGRMSSPPPPPHRYSPEPRGDFSPYDNSPPLSSHDYDDDDDSPPHRYHHRSPPPPLGPYPPPPPPPRQISRWDDPHSSFRPLPPVHRESPRDSKGSALSSGHSSESLDKSSRHSGRV